MPAERTVKRAADRRKQSVFWKPKKTKKTKAVFWKPKKAKVKAKVKDKVKDKAKDKVKDIYPLNPPLRVTHSSVFGQFIREKSENSLLRELLSGSKSHSKHL